MSNTNVLACVPMSRNGVHLGMGIITYLGGLSHFGSLEAHYTRRDGRLHLTREGREFVATFNKDFSRWDNLVESAIPFRVVYSHAPHDRLFQSRWIRSVRDPRDMAVSIFDAPPIQRVGQEVVIEQVLEVPLPHVGGSVFGQGPIEEWVLQECFFATCTPDKSSLHYLSFEGMKRDGVREVRRLANFIGIDPSAETIEQALEANRVEKVRPFGVLSPSRGEPDHWRTRPFAAGLERRFALARQALPIPHAYTATLAVAKPLEWPKAVFDLAQKAWVQANLAGLAALFPSANTRLFREPLLSYSALAGDFVLIEIGMAQRLLALRQHVPFAVDVLTRQARGELWFPKFAALFALARHDPDLRGWVAQELLVARSEWRRNETHPILREYAAQIGFADESVLSVHDN